MVKVIYKYSGDTILREIGSQYDKRVSMVFEAIQQMLVEDEKP